MAVGVGLGTEVLTQGGEEVGEDGGLLRQNRPEVFLVKGRGEREGGRVGGMRAWREDFKQRLTGSKLRSN